jgi:hypothetical protein
MIWREKMWKGKKADYNRKWFTVVKGGFIADKKTLKIVDILKG